MTSLILAILFSTAVALVLKYSEHNRLNRYTVTTINYITAAGVSLFLAVKKGVFSKAVFEFDYFFSEIGSAFKNDTLLSTHSSYVWALFVGIFGGIVYFLGFMYIQKSIKENGVGITGAVSKLSIFIPMVISLILWNEIPTYLQTIGIVLAILSIIIVNLDFKNMKTTGFNLTILLLFIITGFGDFSNKFFQKYGLVETKDFYLMIVFMTALFISKYHTFKSIKAGHRITKKEVLTGIAVGIPNLFTSYFLILSFETVKTTIALPMFSAGAILCINIGGYLFFKEKIDTKTRVSIITIIAAIILMGQ